MKRHETPRTGSNFFAQTAETRRTASNLSEPFPWLGLGLASSIPSIGARLYVRPSGLLVAWPYGPWDQYNRVALLRHEPPNWHVELVRLAKQTQLNRLETEPAEPLTR